MPQALPLVTFDPQSNTFGVDGDTLATLARIPEPLAVVSIAGLFRTGKSFLLNRIILRAPKTGRRATKTPPAAGFGVGNTVQAHTKGIWMWSEPLVVRNADGVDVNVVVLDTEGSGAPSADANHDARISSLGLLISSYFVYNSTGRIDDASLSTLTTITHVTSEMRAEDSGKLPGFLWVLRDFALKLQNAAGVAVDANTYMEEQLSGERNDARMHLRRYFTDRGCATLIRPVTEENDLQNLNTLSDAALRPEFLAAAGALRERILTATANRPLRHNETPLTGGMLGTLVARYVTAVNNGAVPHIADAWESVCAVRMAEAERTTLATFTSTLSALPVDTHPLVAEFRDMAEAARLGVWDAYLHTIRKIGTPRPELHALLTEQMETFLTRYEVAWSGRVGAAANAVVDVLVGEVGEHACWADFWTVVQTRMQNFQSTHGRDKSTMFLLLSAAQRLWDIVPVFFNEVNLSRVKQLEAENLELREEVVAGARTAHLEGDALRLRLEGADKRVESAVEESEEMRVALTKAQEEVRGMTEDVMQVISLRAEMEGASARIHELEDMLTRTEDDAARKAAEAHTAALKSVEALKALRANDCAQHEAVLATVHATIKTQADELTTLRHEHAKALATGRAGAEALKSRTVELEKVVARAAEAERANRGHDDSVRASNARVTELKQQLVASDERARKRPRVSEGDAIALVRAETELGFLRTQKNDLVANLTTCKVRCSDLERQIRLVQRAADETVQRERLLHETALAQIQMRKN